MKDPRPLSERFDLTYVRSRVWPNDWTRWSSVVLALGVGVVLAWMALKGHHAPYTAGHLTKAHAMFGNDCAQCHQADPAGSAYWRPATDNACLRCHAAAAHPDPHRAILAGNAAHTGGRLGATLMAGQCASCHREHRGADNDLSRINDRFCVQCHGNLAKYLGDSNPARKPSGYDTINSFGWDHPEWRVIDNWRVDLTPIRFEHLVHMDPATPQMQQRIAAWVDVLRKSNVDASKIPVTVNSNIAYNGGTPPVLSLSCAACHEPDESGRYMKRIEYRLHCAQCHALGKRGGEEVPHGHTIASFIDATAAKQALSLAAEPPPAPRKAGPRSASRPAALAASQPAVTFESEQAVTAAVARRIEAKREDLARALKPACAKCHGSEAPITKIVNPEIRTRWINKAVFDHRAHEYMACTDCHNEASPATQTTYGQVFYIGEEDPQSPTGKMRWTGRTRDVMLPGIQSCQKCHTPKLAGDSCVMCHVYHGKAVER